MGSGNGDRCSRDGDVCSRMCIGDQGSGMCWEKDWYMCSMMCIVCVRDVMCSRIGNVLKVVVYVFTDWYMCSR
jgi:hypothetical protein